MNSLSQSKEIIIHGWCLLAHPLFLNQLEALMINVENLRKKNPRVYKEKSATKRLAAIIKLIFEKIPKNPTLSEYRQGTTLGKEYKHWFRAKFFQQYRVFFRYHLESKIIIYAWVNDESTKRAYNEKSDAYYVFKKMLTKGHLPNSWNDLLKEAKGEVVRFGKYSNK